MEAVHVLDRVDRADDAALVHVLREGQLDEDAGDPIIPVQAGDEREELVLGRLGGELVVDRLDPHLLARLLLAPDVERGGLVLADEHGRQADAASERRHVARHLRPHAARRAPSRP